MSEIVVNILRDLTKEALYKKAIEDQLALEAKEVKLINWLESMFTSDFIESMYGTARQGLSSKTFINSYVWRHYIENNLIPYTLESKEFALFKNTFAAWAKSKGFKGYSDYSSYPQDIKYLHWVLDWSEDAERTSK